MRCAQCGTKIRREKVRRLLSNPRLRELVARHKEIHVSVRDDDGWSGVKFPPDVDQVRFECTGEIKDLQRLHALYDLFAEILNTLCHIDSAYEDDPQLVL